MTGYNGQSIVYDAVGNPTTYRGISLTWTRGRKLISYGSNTFEYDAQGQRTKKNGITYTYDSQGRILKQSNGLEFFYDTTGVAGIRYNGVDYVYRKDAQGNIIAILDSYGNAVVEYSYDAWGNNNVGGTSVTLGKLNPFRYRGYYYDTETKLYYLQTRYYDPEMGRFINIDNIDYIDPETINGLNLYAYCNNNPVMNVDPDGTWSWSKFWKGVGRIALGVGAIVAGAMVLASGVAGVAMLAIATVTALAGVATTVNGVADIGEAATDYNFMRDGLFQGNEEAYNIFSTVSDTVSTVGSMICGGWLKVNAPRINAYKNVGKFD